MPKPTLQVIVASTRPRRVGPAVADYLVRRIGERGGFEIELLDLAEIDLPLLDEPHHPRLGRYEHAHTKAWSATISRGDAYLIVMPEYNHSFNAALKNARSPARPSLCARLASPAAAPSPIACPRLGR